jgi:hypothetical protein
MSTVSRRVASGHIVPKDRRAESVLQRPPLSCLGFQLFSLLHDKHKTEALLLICVFHICACISSLKTKR